MMHLVSKRISCIEGNNTLDVDLHLDHMKSDVFNIVLLPLCSIQSDEPLTFKDAYIQVITKSKHVHALSYDI